jgi:adenine-specific DNA-methyltransferase
MNIATSSAGETKETNVDLVETFNWLLGLKVDSIKELDGFIRVEGYKRTGGRTRTLIIWRKLSGDPIEDNNALEEHLGLRKGKRRLSLGINPADTDFDFIYVNGSHTLNDPHNKVHLIEETFQRLMFDSTNFESLS